MRRHALMLAFLLLAACGQAGDLYLPSEPAAQPVPPAAPPAPEADKEQKKDAH